MLIKAMGANAEKLAAMNLDYVVSDVDQLTVALALSDLTEIAHTLSNANEGEVQYVAAHKAMDIGWNPTLREDLMKKGFFVSGLRGLLELAETSCLAGSRLMPVFEEAISNHKELGIPNLLKYKLKNYMKKKLETDGFAISHMDGEGKTMVRTAEWVNEKVRNAYVHEDDVVGKDRGDTND